MRNSDITRLYHQAMSLAGCVGKYLEPMFTEVCLRQQLVGNKLVIVSHSAV